MRNDANKMNTHKTYTDTYTHKTYTYKMYTNSENTELNIYSSKTYAGLN
jgi:hypothetical protein